MASEETPIKSNTGATGAPVPREKTLQYVGPGSPGNKDKSTPTFGNIPVNVKDPKRSGTIPGVLHPDELTPEQVEYVMATNTTAKTWWVLK